MLSATEGWAIDPIHNTVLRLIKGVWQTQAATTGQPDAISMTSPTLGWLGGFDVTNQSAFLMRYDGAAWTPVQLPDVAHAEVDTILALSPTDVWAFGTIHGIPSSSVAAWHFANGQWQRQTIASSILPAGASFASPSEGWVAGGGATLLRYHNGTWSVVN
jgi:hypothetical protein